MGIMTYEEWMRRTKLGAFKPRSSALKFLDAAIKEYGRHPGASAYLETLKAAFIAWADQKGNAEDSERNRSGAVTDLMNQIIAFDQTNRPAAHLRPTGLLKDIREGARLMAEGKLKPQVKIHISLGDEDRSLGHVVYEDFDPTELNQAKTAWADAYRCAGMACDGVRTVATSDTEEARFRRWFGDPSPARVNEVSQGLAKMYEAFQHNKVTLANRPDIQVHVINGNDPFGPMQTANVSGQSVYGYVWGGKHTGSGYRVILGRWFLGDPDPIEGAAQTIYHELTHKVLRTTDHGYGKIKSRGFATMQAAKALENADNWAFYAVSFIKDI